MNRPFKMNSLGEGYRALVRGASGAIWLGFCELLNQDPSCAYVRELGAQQCSMPRSGRG